MNGLSRTGILGGTFDPIHLGHLDVAAAARRSLGLAEVIFIPARTPPHRPSAPVASEGHRLAMVELAVAEEPAFGVSDQELRTDAPSYTSVTLENWGRSGTNPWQIFFITGADAFAEIVAWHDYPHVLNLAHFVVVSRPSHPVAHLPQQLPDLAARMRDASMDILWATKPDQTLIWLVDAETRDISSSDIRARLANGDPIDRLVPRAVAAYIERHGTYGAGAVDGRLHD